MANRFENAIIFGRAFNTNSDARKISKTSASNTLAEIFKLEDLFLNGDLNQNLTLVATDIVIDGVLVSKYNGRVSARFVVDGILYLQTQTGEVFNITQGMKIMKNWIVENFEKLS